MWIDRIIEFEPDKRLVAIKNVSLAEEHLHDHFAADASGPAMPLMPASLLIEGMAQTAGVLVGTMSGFREKVILAKIIEARFDREVTPGQTVRYEAQVERFDHAGAATTGIVSVLAPPDLQWREIGAVGLMFSHIDRNVSGLAFPKENFVFSDNFRMILRAAGLDRLEARPPA
jgi:3-hydroxyacyl-[acyl-carrier-protein] dehydratase